MYKTIYSKSSDDRAEKFQVITKIQQDKEEKIVRKIPASSTSKQHVFTIVENFNKLREKYSKTNIVFVPSKIENGCVFVDYVEGTTFEEYIDALLQNNEIEKCTNIVMDYFNNIFVEHETFEKTTEFRNVFGDIVFPKSMEGVRLVDIDMLFGNVIYDEGKWFAYDYEWTFNFLVPIEYIVYRVLSYFSTNKTRQKFSEYIYEKYSISEDDIIVYSDMESNFQRYIYGEIIPMWKLYDHIHGRVVDVKPIAQKYVRNHIFQVYYDYGEGYTEKNSNVIPVVEYKPYNYKVDIIIPEGAKKLRIDPSWSMCVTVIKNLTDENLNNINYITNGYVVKDKVLFFHNDPQILIDLKEKACNCLTLDIEISSIDNENDSHNEDIWHFIDTNVNEKKAYIDKCEHLEEAVNSLVKLRDDLLLERERIEVSISEMKCVIDEIQKQNTNLVDQLQRKEIENESLVNQVKQKEMENESLVNQVQQKNDENISLQKDKERMMEDIEAIYNSTSWKVTKPIRKVKEILSKK